MRDRRFGEPPAGDERLAESPAALPDYSVRVSPRARRVRLQVTLHGRVEVVIPRGFDPRRVPGFVAQHGPWLRRALRRVAGFRQGRPGVEEGLPARVALAALQESWEVRYRRAAGSAARARQGVITVAGGDEARMRAALQRWLHRRARERLVPWLATVAEELGFRHGGVSIRCQKTRWGSCTCRGRINLNRNLLFLPAELVRYLFVHELCHTVHLNHSSAYWGLVGSVEPGYRVLERRLREATCGVPLWAYPE